MTSYFNSRPSARGDVRRAVFFVVVKYFNSRPSARGDVLPGELAGYPAISIHAPPRGATLPFCVLFSCLLYFNSRPSARGDAAKARRMVRPSHFNSRPSARGDAAVLCRLVAIRIFQFTPLREGRPATANALKRTNVFQFTPLREGRRPARSSSAGQLSYFNSRPSARGDGKRYAISANLLFNPYKSAWLNNSATQFVEIILVIFHRIIA